MKLSYRGINHNCETTVLKTDIAKSGKYRGASLNIHSPLTAKRNKSKSHLRYRGVSC